MSAPLHTLCARAALVLFACCAAPAALAAASALIMPADSAGAAATPPYDPAVFGPSAAAEQEAARIVQAWQSEPVTLPWTSLALNRIVKHKGSPTRSARGLALTHVAMYDAWQLAPDALSRKVAVSTAASKVLAYWFPAEEHGFDRILAAVLKQSGITPQQAARGLAIGSEVARRALAHGEADGAARGWDGVRLQWYGEGRYYGPGAWTPTPPYFYYPPDEPFAPGWKTWMLENPSQLRPTPPAFGSERFVRDLQELVDIQKNLTPEQLRIARFWVDGSGSVTPPGHWNQIGQDLVRQYKLDDAATAKLFAMLNVALADTFIAVWDTKYHYWTARPVSMAKTVLGVELKPAILTPPFPSYVSGHAAFSGASARILGAVFPQEASRLDALALEAATSRMYGGIHYRHDNEDGLLLGRAVASIVLKKLN
ncbi:vanadium-dependent haloperoxidase [Pseudoduganella violaceinigra]|uniref:vanadium-dependent haloperoxidase n=1 Tax=Pseudoduganella violaceinigra TaxID=246602 RepID=UPI0004130EF1|nr:vanadium-dependent haloperoxidase [Pseudoduganella violaceinigra]